MFDYLDGLSEESVDEPLANSRRLHAALLDSVTLAPPAPGGYHSGSPLGDDDGYLEALARAARESFASLPRPIAAALTAAGFLILINLLTNPHRIWFHWPVAVILFVVIMRTVLRQGSQSDRKDDR